MSHVLGIDLGTTNSVVSIMDGGEARVLRTASGGALIPSVVSFHPNGSVIVGRDARERRLIDAQNTIYSVKRLIGRPYESAEVRQARERFPFELRPGPSGGVLVEARGLTYTLAEISAFVLKEIRSVAEQATGIPCTRAVVTVPANFDELQRSATKAAGRVAGLEVLRILNEPTAAALAYGYGRGSKERVAVFDLGGGTFDLTILHLAGDVIEVIATAGDTYLGGDDVDALIADQMAEAFLAHHRYDPRADRQALERLRAAAEWAKCQLSSKTEVQLKVEELAYGAGGKSLDLSFGMTRSALEAMARPLISRAFDVCDDAMRVAGMLPGQLDNVILVGGSTRMPLVQQMVAEYFGRKPLAGIDPDLVVSKGAAIQGYALRTARGRTGRRSRTSTRRSGPSQPPQPARPTSSLPPISASPIFDEPTRPSVRPGSLSSPPSLPASAVAQRPIAAVGTPRTPPPPPPRMPPPPKVPKVPKVPKDSWESVMEPMPQPPAPPPGPAWQPDRDSVRAPAPPAPPAPPPLAPPPVAAPAPPLLVDVTPFSLGVETVDGYCEHIIKRNSPVPTEQTRIFAPGRQAQAQVAIRIAQGESRRLEQNQLLGEVVLDLDPSLSAARTVDIEVTFVLDSDGTLGVRARDQATGREQVTRIRLIGGIAEDELERMQERLEQLTGP
ncbi:MAG: Hsp70 family protein [Deltaproteobacteria bacterium]|nr:Hsp70 family protein [Deltaproteobacteria bacterium]